MRLGSTRQRRGLSLEAGAQKTSHKIGARETSNLEHLSGNKASATWWIRGSSAGGCLASTYAQVPWEPISAKLPRLSCPTRHLFYTSLGRGCRISARDILARLAEREMATFYFE